MRKKNEMLLGNDDVWNGENVSDIKEFATHSDEFTKNFKLKKREIALWNKVSKQLRLSNPDIVENWKNIKANYSNQNHITEFVERVFSQVNNKRYSINQLGKIEVIDDGSRGLAKTFQMHLLDNNGAILDMANIHCNKYNYL